MSTLSKEGGVSSPAIPVKGSSASSTLPSYGYIPSGVMLATILKALRDAQDNDLEMQQEQAEVEQKYDQQLGGLDGSGISKGLIAMVADSTAQAGQDEAAGLEAQGLSSAINAGLSGATTLGVLGYGGYNAYKGGKLDDDIEQNKNFDKELDKASDGDLVVGAPKKMTDQELEALMDRKGLKADGSYDQDAINALKADGSVQRLKEMNADKLKDLQKQQGDFSQNTHNAMLMNQTIGQVSQAATGSYASYEQAGSKVNSAADNASAAVQKQVQDMNYSSSNTFKQQAETSAQQALQIADALAQVAQSQVQFRG